MSEQKMIGFKQGRFSTEAEPNKNLVMQRFKVKPSRATSISSGSTILSIGLMVGLGVVAFEIPNSNLDDFFSLLYGNVPGLSGIFNLLSLLIFFIMFDPVVVVSPLIVGYFMGGFVSAMSHKHEGKRGPIYTIYIAFSLTVSIAFLTGLVTLNSGVSTSVGTVMGQFYTFLIVGLICTIISIPLSFFAWLGYKIGMYFGTL
ncbi:MAG: hypothetical protein INQ03_05645 [Candidatus Heimdallarchaeota archaeon]|nr:hypothetical protein [Candidatus Heimdallarchaeota archaeon]